MNWKDWGPTEREIRLDFGYSESEDLNAAHLMKSLRADWAPWPQLWAKLQGNVTVVGCGPSLATITARDIPQGPIIAADGAALRLKELGVVPAVVVTDLDGASAGWLWAQTHGAAIVVHAHGDNTTAIGTWVPQFQDPLWGTHHGPPQSHLKPLANFGGFTDGDRGVLLAQQAGATSVDTLCFELHREPGIYSHHYDDAIKPRKLAWAARIIAAARAAGLAGQNRPVDSASKPHMPHSP